MSTVLAAAVAAGLAWFATRGWSFKQGVAAVVLVVGLSACTAVT